MCVMYDKRFAGGYFSDVEHSADWLIGSAPQEKTYDRLEQQIQTQTQIHTTQTQTLCRLGDWLCSLGEDI